MNFALIFRLAHRGDLVTGLNQFCQVHSTYSARKVLKACTYQHQFISGGGGDPT